MSAELSYDSKRLTNAFTSPCGRLRWWLILLPAPPPRHTHIDTQFHLFGSVQCGPLSALPGETVKCNITFTTKWLQFIVTGVKMQNTHCFPFKTCCVLFCRRLFLLWRVDTEPRYGELTTADGKNQVWSQSDEWYHDTHPWFWWSCLLFLRNICSYQNLLTSSPYQNLLFPHLLRNCIAQERRYSLCKND